MFDDENVSPDSDSTDVDRYVMTDSHARAPRHLFIVSEAVDVPFYVFVDRKVEFLEGAFGHEVDLGAVVE